MNTAPLSLILGTLLSLVPTSNTAEDARLLLELHTIPICFIKRGHNVPTTVYHFYRYLDESKIAYPQPETEAGRTLWRQAIERATPAKCNQLLDVNHNLSNI